MSPSNSSTNFIWKFLSFLPALTSVGLSPHDGTLTQHWHVPVGPTPLLCNLNPNLFLFLSFSLRSFLSYRERFLWSLSQLCPASLSAMGTPSITGARWPPPSAGQPVAQLPVMSKLESTPRFLSLAIGRNAPQMVLMAVVRLSINVYQVRESRLQHMGISIL